MDNALGVVALATHDRKAKFTRKSQVLRRYKPLGEGLFEFYLNWVARSEEVIFSNLKKVPITASLRYEGRGEKGVVNR